MFIQAIIGGVIGYFALVCVMCRFTSPRLYHTFSLICAVMWAGAVIYLTILTRVPILETRIHMTPLAEAQPYGMMENAVLFLPFGCIFIGLFPHAKLWTCILAGIGASVAIELVQLFSHRGICDIDDLIANSAGVVLGTLIYLLIRRLTRASEARA